MPPPFENGEGALRVIPVRAFVHSSVRYQNLKDCIYLFKFGMLIYNIKTQVELNLGYNPLIFDRVMGLL